jgi:pyruvate formate lyase activating enzyme
MIIAGLQKLTLIDYPEKVACTIFLYGCNLRCGFCHNPSLVTGLNESRISEEEVLGFLEKR